MPSKEPAKLLIASIDAVATCSLLENTKKKCNQEYKQETALKIFIKKNEKIHKNMIVERKGGVSSWIRLGPNSIGCFIDGLEACIENAGTGTWERKWKDSGRSFLMVRGQNKGGLFIRLEVTNLENKRYNIYIPKGNGDKSG